jgi:hypothetical protein
VSDFDAIDFFRTSSLVTDPYSYFDYLREKGRVWREPITGSSW